MLEIINLSKHFGGIEANHEVNLRLKRQQIHALIGPNGAGKSTLIAQIAGELKPDNGQIRFNGEDISHSPAEKRSRMGLGRMFQTPALFEQLSVIDNVRLPLLRHYSGRNRLLGWLWPNLVKDAEISKLAFKHLRRLGMQDHPQQLVSTLSHGEQRQLEMVMTLATSPSCLLLDEPMAGLSSEESIRMIQLIRNLKKDHAILLVEHDMNAVFDLADTISVLVEGRIIASGEPEQIRANEAVQRAYLGDA